MNLICVVCVGVDVGVGEASLREASRREALRQRDRQKVGRDAINHVSTGVRE
ncbi:hypothetical protein IQ276_001390 [Desmonostoc muscorum LEGE 12446]|uniref:Uncharacterized protein n=1 Tax=Desmonostoc muscorum LEGE 12446 TaxID=1828758 RepID=A0A8J6ZX00_DESMC|nr:hypothetical protein [Desmonostoc muscorum]MCF2145125.1 hypothetical protein [Desmonostoc muscorum LEGE 12446]